MKKTVRFCAVALLVAAAAAVVVYRAVNRVPSSELPLNEQVYTIFEDGGCLSCHSADPELPFYAKMPVAGKIVMKDIDSGYRAFDMTAMMEAIKLGSDVNPVDLAKVEKVVLDDRMPMPKYYLVHWGSSLTKAKRNIVLDCPGLSPKSPWLLRWYKGLRQPPPPQYGQSPAASWPQ